MENAKFDAFKKKLEGICDENNLVFRFRYETYPITLTISPVSGLEAQMTMLEMAGEKPVNSPDAKLVFSVEDGALTYAMSERFSISDALFNKIKNLFKNMHYMYLQFLHRECIEKKLLRAGAFPEAESVEPSSDDVEEYVDANDMDEVEQPEAPECEDMPEEVDHGTYLLRAATEYAHTLLVINCTDLMRKFNIGFSAAARLMDELEDAGVVGDITDNGKRVVLPEEADE